MSHKPNAAWIAKIAEETTTVLKPKEGTSALLLRDFDGKFTKEFDRTLKAAGIEVKKVGPRKPNQNAFAERWVQSIKQECLDRFVVFGEDHLRHIIAEYLAHYNEERPHQARDNLPLSMANPPEENPLPAPSAITCHERLGGLLKHYVRAA
jgi:putative transposase